MVNDTEEQVHIIPKQWLVNLTSFSANKGISAFISPNGYVIKSLNTRESGNIELKFPDFYRITFFSK